MRTRLLKIWDSLISSLWFVPVLLTGLAIGASFLSVYIDTFVQPKAIKGLWLFYSGGADGARQLLSTVAGSMITVAGVVFSITIVALTLASQQFGPRLLRSFMRDRGNQLVLGTFIATFIYCLLILRTVRGADGADFVPSISITFAVLLAMTSLAVLIYFIHHVALSIQATTIIDRVRRELEVCARRMFPEELGVDEAEADREQAASPEKRKGKAVAVRAAESGYVQAIVSEKLLEIAVSGDLVLRLLPRPGDYVTKGQTIAEIFPTDKAVDQLEAGINRCLVLGAQRSSTQDIRLLFDQLTEIAVRALSPGINDPYTVMNCLDHLGTGLALIAGRKVPSPFRYDEGGELRVLAEPVTFAEIAEMVMSPIRRYGASSATVLLHMLDVIRTIAPFTKRSEDRMALVRHTELIREAAVSSMKEESDRSLMETHAAGTLGALTNPKKQESHTGRTG